MLDEEKTGKAKPTLPGEADFTSTQRKTVANIRQGFKELKLVKEGKLQTRPLADLLDEL